MLFRSDQGGADYLDATVGPGSSAARRYLEKIDGMALEDIPATRVERLLIGQAAPNGFYYPRKGIGQLMNAAAGAIRARGGTTILGRLVGAIDVAGSRTRGIVLGGSSGEEALSTRRVIVAVPTGHATRLAVPRAPTSATPTLRMRAVAIVYLAAQVDRLTGEPWIQIDDPDVPFARLFEPANWSPALSQSGRTVIGCECYCQEGAQDPIWRHTDESLGRWCAEALTEVLGLIERPNDVELVEVVRLPRAYPVVPVSEIVRAIAPARWLSNVAGLEIAQGGAVIEAIEAGEAAAGRALADL